MSEEQIRRLIADIAADREHGASWLARRALTVVDQCAQGSTAHAPADLLQEIATCANALIEARPGMAPLRFWMEWLLRDLGSAAENATTLDDLRSAISTLVASLIAESEREARAAVENAVARLPADGVIFTASLSQTIVDALTLAQRTGKLRGVLAAESVDPSGHRYGNDLASALRPAGVAVEVVPDQAIATRVADATHVWLGADSVLADGSVLNGTPSLTLAVAAKQAGRPVAIVCESAKIDRWTSPDAVVAPPGFDRIPADLIDVVITDAGAWEPSRARPGGDRLSTEARIVSAEPASQSGSAPASTSSIPDPRPLPPDPAVLVARIAARLIERKETVAVAESSAGGRVCDLLTDRAGSSAWFAGGMIAYSNASKQQVAGIAAEQLASFGAVSSETALALAEGARRLFGTAWGIGETGIAGPQTGRRSSKPAGLSYVAVVGPGNIRRAVEVNSGSGERAENKQAFAIAALQLLAEELERTA